MQHAKDIELVERIRRGDQEAWAAFLARYTDLIYGIAATAISEKERPGL